MRYVRPLAVAFLLVAAAATTWWLLLLRGAEAPPVLVGPPRSDYHVRNYQMIAFDEAGKPTFSAAGPALSRHPQLGTLDLEAPRLEFPDHQNPGQNWQAQSTRAWISADAAQIRLSDDVRLIGPITPSATSGPDISGQPKLGQAKPGQPQLRLETSDISIFPKARRAASEASVTISDAGSILRGRGLRAEFDARRLQLLAEVRVHYDATSH